MPLKAGVGPICSKGKKGRLPRIRSWGCNKKTWCYKIVVVYGSKENKITPNDPTYSIEFKMYLLTQMSSSIVWGHASGISTTKKVF